MWSKLFHPVLQKNNPDVLFGDNCDFLVNNTASLEEAGIIGKWCGVLITVNAFTLILLCFNTVQFLIRQRRYKVLYLSLFYAISITIMTLRVLYFSIILVYLRDWSQD